MANLIKNPHHLAWVTLITSFTFFCVISVSTLWLIRYVLFDLPMDLNTVVYVSRGTIGVLALSDTTERNVRDQVEINNGDRISTDDLSQGHITFHDPLHTDRVVATLQLLPGSEINLKKATRPRFLGDSAFAISLTEASGDFEIVVANDLARDVLLEIESSGRRLRLDQGGTYLIHVDENVFRVTVQRGMALLIGPQNQTKLLETDEVGTLDSFGNFIVQAPSVNLIQNANFAEGGSEAVLPATWGCNNIIDPVYDSEGNSIPQPRGIYERTTFQGRTVLYIRRVSSQSLNHGETFCEQPLNVDVSGYQRLVVRANFYVVSHSVPGCGQQASECALMLRIKYRSADDPENVVREWIHGFYTFYDETTGWRLRCDTCTLDHERVNRGTWYTFESENLMEVPIDFQNRRPVEILNVRFYASGHQYEVYVTDVSILVE